MKSTLYITKGLPASGKSTRAKEMVLAAGVPKLKRICKDDLRAMLDCGKYTGANEGFVLDVRNTLIAKALGAGNSVIVDDTNLNPRHEVYLRELASKCNAIFEVIDFTNVSIETCIERDLKRQNSVGEAVIRKMWRDYLAPNPPVIEYNPKLPSCIICDIDGTVALMNGRGPYEGEKCDTDLPNKPVVELVRQVYGASGDDDKFFFVSGRFEAVRSKTETWLVDNVIGLWDGLFMRQDGDTREDSIIKQEIYEREFKDKYNVWFVLDDRNRVVNKWRELGLTCLQVAPGDF